MTETRAPPQSENSDPWKQLAKHRETLEMCVEEDTPFAERAETLLEKLDEEGY